MSSRLLRIFIDPPTPGTPPQPTDTPPEPVDVHETTLPRPTGTPPDPVDHHPAALPSTRWEAPRAASSIATPVDSQQTESPTRWEAPRAASPITTPVDVQPSQSPPRPSTRAMRWEAPRVAARPASAWPDGAPAASALPPGDDGIRPGVADRAPSRADHASRTRTRTRTRRRRAARAAPLPRCAVLGAAPASDAVAAGLALVARRQHGAPAAVVVVVTATRTADDVASSGLHARPQAQQSAEVPAATQAARRLVEQLNGIGVDAVARGRLAWAEVTVADTRGAAALERIAAFELPAVLLVRGARTEPVEVALAGCAVLVHVTREVGSPLSAVLIADAESTRGPPVLTVARPGRLAAALARSGRGATSGLSRLAAACAEVAEAGPPRTA